jgi:hypothetical protein
MFGTIDQSSSQGIAFNVAANDQGMVIILYREAFVPLLIDVPKRTGVVVGTVSGNSSLRQAPKTQRHLHNCSVRIHCSK